MTRDRIRRRKTRDLRTRTDKAERRKRSYPRTSTFQQAEEEQQPGTSAGQVLPLRVGLVLRLI